MDQFQRLVLLAVVVTTLARTDAAPAKGFQTEIEDASDDVAKQQQQQQQQEQAKRADVDESKSRRDDQKGGVHVDKSKRGPGIGTGTSDEPETAEGGGGSSKTIIIVLVIVLLLVGVGVTVFAQKKKILCFKPKPGSEDATGESPLLKGGTTSPSKATSASGTTLDKSRPSATSMSTR